MPRIEKLDQLRTEHDRLSACYARATSSTEQRRYRALLLQLERRIHWYEARLSTGGATDVSSIEAAT